MQTITVPWTSSTDDRKVIASWQKAQGCVVRSAFSLARDAVGNQLAEGPLRDLVKKRFPEHPLGSWAVHCGVREGLSLRNEHPDGKVVFGGKAQLERRRKGLISQEEWRLRRNSRPITIVGDRTKEGNRHLSLSDDGLTATVTFLKQSVTLHLPEMSGKDGRILRALGPLMRAGEIGVQFSLWRNTISFTFNYMDLRKLAPGETLEALARAEREAKGHKARGRPRKDPMTFQGAHRIKPLPIGTRPVHPEWRPTIPTMTTRAVGIDLNPQWIGLSVIEIPSSADPQNTSAVRILDHHLLRIEIPIDAPKECMAAAMARCARLAVSLARKWSVSCIWHEHGLGRLYWSKKSRSGPKVQTVNHWSRTVLLGGLARRCALSGIQCRSIWGGYTSTIGNLVFPLPDACAAATEIARRGLALSRGAKDRLPVIPQRVHLQRWKDGELPDEIVETIDQAGCWPSIHRAIKPTQGRGFPPAVGYRRPHPEMGPGPLQVEYAGYAVSPHGSRKSGWITAAKPRPEDSRSATRIASG